MSSSDHTTNALRAIVQLASSSNDSTSKRSITPADFPPPPVSGINQLNDPVESYPPPPFSSVSSIKRSITPADFPPPSSPSPQPPSIASLKLSTSPNESPPPSPSPVSPEHVVGDLSGTLPSTLRSISSSVDRASIEALLQQLNSDALPAPPLRFKSRLLDQLPPPPPTESGAVATNLPLPRSLQPLSSLDLTQDDAKFHQLQAEYLDIRAENELIDRWGDIVQQENDLYVQVRDAAKTLASFVIECDSTVVARRKLRIILQGMLTVHDKLTRERTLIASRLASIVFDATGGAGDSSTAISLVDDEPYWEQKDEGHTIFCFQAMRTTHRLLQPVSCTIRIEADSKRIVLRSSEWAREIVILFRSIESIDLPDPNRPEVLLVVRRAADETELESFILGRTIHSLHLAKILNGVLHAHAVGRASLNDSASALAPTWNPVTIDVSAVHLSPDLIDLCHAVNAHMKTFWAREPDKLWLKGLADMVLNNKSDVDVFLMGGKNTSITYEITDSAVRLILTLGVQIEPLSSGIGTPISAVHDVVVGRLAEHDHAHWCQLVDRLNMLHAKRVGIDRVQPRPLAFFRPVAWADLPAAEQQDAIQEAERFIQAIKDFGYILVDKANGKWLRSKGTPLK